MGQAFDKDGHVLGEATGETKREVLEALERDHPDAAEIRIRSLKQQIDRETQTTRPAALAASDPVVTQPIDPPPGPGPIDPPISKLPQGVALGDPQRDRMLQFFRWAHLPPALQEASRPFCDLAHRVVERYPSNPERTVALRKLLEAKDAAVRALLYEG